MNISSEHCHDSDWSCEPRMGAMWPPINTQEGSVDCEHVLSQNVMGCLNTNALLAWIDEDLIFRPRNMTAPLYRLAYHIWRRTFIGNSPDSDRTETQWKKKLCRWGETDQEWPWTWLAINICSRKEGGEAEQGEGKGGGEGGKEWAEHVMTCGYDLENFYFRNGDG